MRKWLYQGHFLTSLGQEKLTVMTIVVVLRRGSTVSICGDNEPYKNVWERRSGYVIHQ